MERSDSRTEAELDAPPHSHIGLIGGLGVGAAVICYRAITPALINAIVDRATRDRPSPSKVVC
jgi:hypothetical protein